jgi:hypothetical protein
MALVEELHISTVQPLHATRKIRLRGLDDQVVVIGQQAERATGPFVANDDGAQEGQERPFGRRRRRRWRSGSSHGL